VEGEKLSTIPDFGISNGIFVRFSNLFQVKNLLSNKILNWEQWFLQSKKVLTG
jgi:hypothetical protein